jgi:replicative DNA helicase
MAEIHNKQDARSGDNDMAATAKLFAALGLPVFPVSAGGKVPYKETNGLKDATTSIQQIEKWVVKYPNSNWALATGRLSGITVVDIDPRNGGLDSIRQQAAKYGAAPKTPTVKTGGGGYHYYFRNPQFTTLRNGSILPGIDIKTEGGYVLIPDSVTEGPYNWANGLSIQDVDLAELPTWIIEMATLKKDNHFNDEGVVISGNRNNYLTSLAGSMRRRGMTEAAINAALHLENKDRCSPPLPSDEVDRIVASIMSYRPDEETLLRFMDGDGENLDIKADAISSENSIIKYILGDEKEDTILAEIFSNLSAEIITQSFARDIFITAKQLYNNGVTVSFENIEMTLSGKGSSLDLNLTKKQLNVSAIHYIGDVNFHVDRISTAWILSRSVEIFKRSLNESQKGTRTPQDIIAEVSSELMRLTNKAGKNNMLDTAEAVREVLKMMEDSRRGVFQAVQKTGLAFLDDLIMGLPKGEITVIAGRPSQGKAFDKNSKVPTPWGTTTYGEIMPGDYVFGSNGLPTRVLAVFDQGVLPIYEVEFKDGTIERVSGEHLWAVNSRNRRKRGNSKFSVVTTDEIRSQIKKNNGRTNFVTPASPTIHYPAKRLPIDPYVLGVLLADGGLTTNYLGITTGDPWIIEEVNRLLPENHSAVKIKDKPYEYRLSNPVTRRNLVRQSLDSLGLLGLGSWDKFIPDIYLHASVEQRVHLLQGLMDSDGSVNNRTSGRYLTASTRLADDITVLVRSLGGYVTRQIRTVDDKQYQRLYMSFPAKPEWKPFRIARKADAYEHYTKNYYGKPIVDVRPAGEAECVCIKVEAEDGLFMTDNFNVTHNTAFALKLAYSVADQVKKNGAVVIFSAEMSARQLMARNISREAKVNSQHLRDARRLDVEDSIKVDKAVKYITENINIYIDETPNPSPSYMQAKLAAINAHTPVVLVIFDYAELGGSDVEDSWSLSNKTLRLEENFKKYKIIAKTMDIPMVILSQLSRAVEENATEKSEPIPRMAHLRWSGMIEQIANVIMMLYYPWHFWNNGIPYKEIPEKDYYEIIVPKNRDGEVGSIPARFIKEYGDFEAAREKEYIEENETESTEANYAWEG